MKLSFPILCLLACWSFVPVTVTAADFPSTVTSTACLTPPTIDGKLDEAEWAAAPVVEFEMSVLQVKTQMITRRKCEWRAMNSANGLYVALRVPDPTFNKSLMPLDFDLVSLAFSRGAELVAGDDRKVIAPGIYVDKHVVSKGKEADDQHADGKGAMQHAAGGYTIEWAVPLNSGDAEDLQAKPGDNVRFNLAYIDAFQPDLKTTQMGTLYVGGLDVSAQWGTLKLAADVKDDGGAAFRGPEWVRKIFDGDQSPPLNRLRISESSLLPSPGGMVARVLVEYDYRHPQGQKVTGKAKLYLPTDGMQVAKHLPLYYSAGYELDDNGALVQAARGFAVATPRALDANPLVRTSNPDTALLHIVRAFPFIDNSKVVIGGGSAGGYATLMLAAEAFPVLGAVPAVPPVNWGYNAAYFLQRENGASRKNPKGPTTPVFDVIVPIVQAGTKVYGADTSSVTYFRHSPVAHLNTITCPVSIYWTTADMLVPIDQVGAEWVRPIDPARFPEGFTFSPEKLTTSPEGRQLFIDGLKPEDYELVVIPEAAVKEQITRIQKTKLPPELTFSKTRQWSITILDEGAPEPQVGHTKHAVPWSQQQFVQHLLTQKIAPGQLTESKLRRLMDRYSGREWLPTELVHLDDPATEQADVIRGLRTYVAGGPEHVQRFATLYKSLPGEAQVLPAEIMEELTAGGASGR